ncbi:MAG: glycosyltransferase [Salibacteraceae bacterium]
MKQTVLVAPLPWGLGHATRCIPIIRRELRKGHNVLVAASGDHRALLQGVFGNRVSFIDLPFMKIGFPASRWVVLYFLLRSPLWLYWVGREKIELNRSVVRHGITKIISDNRLGLFTEKARCIYVTHQLHIVAPVLGPLLNLIHRWFMAQYDEIWVPDYASPPGLAGVLSHPGRPVKNARYIGPLSRFEQPVSKTEKTIANLAIISGPEPARSHFENEIIKEFADKGTPALVLRGKPGLREENFIGNVRVVSHMEDDGLVDAIARAENIVCRSGYSTIMDLHVLGVTARLVPTPGQAEQMYLAQLHNPANGYSSSDSK